MKAQTTIPEMQFCIKKTRRSIPFEDVEFTSPNIVATNARNLYGEDLNIYESSYAIFFAQNMKPRSYIRLSSGGAESVLVDIKMLLCAAINSLSFGVILIHNHPSGNPKPSRADVAFTEKVRKALQAVDMKLIDHVIITSDGYFSMSEN